MRNPKRVLLIVIGILMLGLNYSCKKSKQVAPAPALPPVNLIAYWPLNGNANDASRYSNNGTANNVTFVANRNGKANSAAHFDGASSFIIVPDSVRLRLANTDFTLNAWVKLDAYNNLAVSSIISKRTSGYNGGWLWAINGNLNTPVGATYFGPGGGNSDAIGNTILSTGSWYMVTCVYSLAAQTMAIYVNGSLDHSTGTIASPNGSITTALYIGKDVATGEDSYFLSGTLDEIRIYNTALDPTSIQQLYTNSN
jgi:hypothetical protein